MNETEHFLLGLAVVVAVGSVLTLVGSAAAIVLRIALDEWTKPSPWRNS